MTQPTGPSHTLPDCCVPAGGEAQAGYSPGDVQTRLQAALGSAYRIDRELLGGGQSRVFAAVETALGRHVAIKVLPTELAATIDAERFHRETHLVASLQHPHIVPLLAAGTVDGMLYYTMPLVEGESLRERIARDGPLPIPEGIRILLEIADALAYANAHGVVHRDIKPGNVLLSVGHALVTDFGIAKAVDGATAAMALTSAGVALGTPTYMAPEQGMADTSSDHRADIYSLGIVGYEMLAGHPPFAGTLQQVLVAHATAPPKPLTGLRDDVPPALDAMIMRCLEKEPAARPGSAAEVRDQLETLWKQHQPHPEPTLASASRRSHRFAHYVLGGSLIAAALGIGVVVRGYAKRPALDPHRVIVAAFKNESGDPNLEQVSTMAADWIIRGLTETGLADPVLAAPKRDSNGRVVSGELEPMGLVSQARALGGRYFIAGTIYAIGDSVRLNALIADATNGDVFASVPVGVGPRTDPMAAINFVRTSLLAALAAMSPSERFGMVSPEAPPSYAAYAEFLRGEEAFSRGAFETAIEHDKRAIGIDPTYLAPLVRMAYAFVNVGDCARTDSLGRVLKTKRERLPAYEGYYLDRVLAWCAGDMNAAYLAARGMATVAPHSTYAKYISARSAIPVNHPLEAVDALERLDWRKPHISGYYHDLTVGLHKLKRFDRELEVAELYRVRHSGSLIPMEDQVRALAALGRVDQLRRVVAASIAMTSVEPSASQSTVMLMACHELVAHGHREVARGIARDLVDWLRRPQPTADNDLTMMRALMATEEFAAALPIARRLLAAHPEDPRYLTVAGVIAAALGDSAEARRLAAVLHGMQRPRGSADPFYGQAAIDARLGDRANAVRLLRESVRRGNSDILISDADPFFLSLRGYPPFEELVKPKG